MQTQDTELSEVLPENFLLHGAAKTIRKMRFENKDHPEATTLIAPRVAATPKSFQYFGPTRLPYVVVVF